jgi:squalene cyclase
MRQRHAPSVHVHLTYPEAWQTLNGLIVRRGTLDALLALGQSDVLDAAVSDLDHARGALERAMGLLDERRAPDGAWSEAELRYAHGDR